MDKTQKQEDKLIFRITSILNYITDENKRAKKAIFVSRKPWEAIWKSICVELNVFI